MPKIYFLCTGNSCRSQMAEGFAQKYFPKNWEVRSAGIETHGLNPKAVIVMQELGIDISQHQSELIDSNYLNQCASVVTLCGDAKDKCPITPKPIKRIHWPLNDPAQATVNETEIIQTFRQVRDDIEQRVQALSTKIK